MDRCSPDRRRSLGVHAVSRTTQRPKSRGAAALPKRRPWAAVLVVVLVTLLGLQALSRWIPPLQSPDELSHLVRIASLTEGQWVPVTQPGGSTGGSIDVGLTILARAYAPVIRDRNAPVPEEDRQLVQRQGWTGSTVHGEAPGSAVVLPLAYAPAATGLALGRALEWTVLDSYHLARFVSQAFCVAVIGMAVWIWRPPLLALAVLLLPMSLFQMSSPVVDGPAHALTLLVLSMLMRLRSNPSMGLAVATATLLAALVTIRLHLLPLLALPLWWGWRGMRAAQASGGSGRMKLAVPGVLPQRVATALVVAGFAAVLACGLWVLWALMTVVDTRVQRPLSTGGVLMHYLSNPQDLWGVISRTFSDLERLRFLSDSFIGNLGWLDTRLPEEAYAVLWWGLGALLLLGLPWRETLRGNAMDRGLLLGCALMSVTIAFALMLLTWSPFPTEKIEGVQGRYFIAPAMVLAFALGGWSGRGFGDVGDDSISAAGRSRWPTLQTAGLIAFALASLWFLVPTLMARYPHWAASSLWG